MENKAVNPQNTLPKMIPTILAGFNTVAGRSQLIILPILLDLLFWFGPHLRIKTLAEPIIADLIKNVISLAPDLSDAANTAQSLWSDLLTHYNISTSLSTFPVGVPALFTSMGTLNTPLGTTQIFELPSTNIAFWCWVGFCIIGIVLGVVYLDAISRATAERKITFDWKNLWNETFNSLLITLLIFAIALLAIGPLMFLLSIGGSMGSVGQVLLVIVGFILIWVLMPFIFSVHGIFVNGQRPINSIMFSVRLVRFVLPGTGLFILTSFILYAGLNILWQAPAETSWMALVGILGHAFIVTSLIAASFLYYRSGIRLMQANMQRTVPPPIIKPS
jgi:hypothetical protein